MSILKLLELFNSNNFIWQIDTAEIYLKDSHDNFTFEQLLGDERFITENKLKQSLINKKYFLVFLTICAFPDMKKNIPTWIRTASDFNFLTNFPKEFSFLKRVKGVAQR
ncbi:DUF2691 family protein [Bacillus wiedmannii]|uniref:DUF2691 family protein n=1 Tax=Bacillus wiedmannii TaxID=1890302 RepID=UPI0021D2F9E5|nr:DUF2691 family protein [Bacillus wiedmannii]MCU5332339.1 DUF2691 family protein [Bacillus wiedmannii]